MRRIGYVVAMVVMLAIVGIEAEGQAKPAGAKAAAAVTTPVNINTATAAQLEALPRHRRPHRSGLSLITGRRAEGSRKWKS